MPTTYDKLVRDHIPDIIRSSGRRCAVVTMSDAEYRDALLQKLLEEAREVALADSKELVSEVADLLEVIDALLAAHAIPRETVVLEQERRRGERGGFARRLRLVWAEQDDARD